MKQINNNYDERYYITEEGKIYNSFSGKYLKDNCKHNYSLKTTDGKYKKVSLKELYKLVYGCTWCVDDVESLPNEEWKEIEGTDGFYYVSTEGRVKSTKGYKSIVLKKYIDKYGYAKVTIVKDGERQCKLVGGLVGSAFLLPDENVKFGYELHHKNLNPSDDRLSNLMYLSKEEHRKIHNQIRKEKKGENEL